MGKSRCNVNLLALCLYVVFPASFTVADGAAPSVIDDQAQAANAGITEAGQEKRYSRKVKAEFDDVFADLEFAITEKNYRITGVNSIGRAITDRGSNPFPRASVVHFCNIEAAKQILEISMDYLLLMPCRITLHEIDNGYVLIEARLLPLNDEKLRETAIGVNSLLREIVDFAAGDW